MSRLYSKTHSECKRIIGILEFVMVLDEAMPNLKIHLYDLLARLQEEKQ